jgi:biopolymer transport protein ExbB
MIDSFNELELGGSLVDPSILAGGIWTALLTTAMGLIVAIPALISHYFFEKKLSNYMQLANAFLTKLIGKSNV